MKKMMLWLLMALVFMLGAAMAEEVVDVRFTVYSGAGETVQPDYPDLASQIGEGLTQDDFIITYSTNSQSAYYMTVDETTGQLTMLGTLYSPKWMDIFITYTPKVEGVGVKTVFACEAYAGRRLTDITLSKSDLTLGLDQTANVQITLNNFYIIDHLTLDAYDENVVEAVVQRRSYDMNYQYLTLTPKGVGETTITVRGYNGVNASVHVKVLEPVTELTFAQEVYECYTGDAISLGIRLGEGDVERAANFKEARVNGNQVVAGKESKYFLGTDGIMGLFCVDSAGDYLISATTYNGFSDSATVKVYDKATVVRLESSVDTIRMGDDSVQIFAYDAEGKKLRIKRMEVTGGADIASLQGESLITTGVGEIEVTAWSYDGTTFSQTFTVEVMPTRILHNAENLVMEIGETFDVEVWFDQGELPYGIGVLENGYTEQKTQVAVLEGNRITAQAPGQSKMFIRAGDLWAEFSVTVLDGDKAIRLDVPQPLHVGQSYQLYVRDKTGEIYPAAFSINYYCPYAEVTSRGYLTALRAGTVELSVKLDDGRTMRIEGIKIIQSPQWLKHDAVVIRKSQKQGVAATSDVGLIPNSELSFQVANENVLTIVDGVITPKRTGTTKVTITSLISGVSTSFTVEVIGDASTLYLGVGTMYVASGTSMYLPTVYDENGKEVAMNWAITHNNPGEGNPDASGFTVEGDVISCHWPTASCEVTGTRKGGNQKVKVTVYGCRLPEMILLEPEQIWMKVGERKTLTITTEEEDARILYAYWMAEPAGIVTMPEIETGSNNVITGVSEGVALVAAMLENEAIAVSVVTVYDPEKRLPGDANGDGLVNILDPLLVMQYASGWSVFINGQQGDVDADGKTTLQDAVQILKFDAGMDVQLKQYIPAP